ncbi:DUF5007 domain-containing protein [Sphingobacterium faecium NBRC 15299]|jgi:hypothetical protein|uniref:DUF5007 domain-containing protein n=1 Tax=Sphingobacterium faecium TaxID=34087 RepID=UPI000D3D786A|nr:DUF5007 domain-containing protein [Sphingobacterium faecium]MQP26286.1 DUF5007 domain-containing protein [Sphingobacterium faecium]PTX10754.1 uncharacterized protein DUF5007 [Sphingobacterium faecium]UZJ64810.1 DUF5007 domain-containing protein [Sphingobacterium sp. KU25419]GEM62632.1 DUF5007 domain-containing protein [Sphingobacterium faecium NBRC 15299]
MNIKFYNPLKQVALFGLGLFVLASCKNNIPDDIDSLGQDIVYSNNEITPILGRNTFYNNLVSIGQNTSQPLTFKMVNIRDIDGQPATIFNDKLPVTVWKESYNGLEKSIAEINAKRKTEYRPILEVLEHSGNINFWGESANAGFIKAQPDSGYVFDIEVSNTGGRRYIRNFKLKPFRERPYEPSIIDPITGLSMLPYTWPQNMRNMLGNRTKKPMFNSDVNVYFNKLESKGAGSSTLTISFLDSLNNPIDPAKFNATNWEKLVHGFKHRFENKKVVYDVAYPIPLAPIETDYAPNGREAYMQFKYRRIGNFGQLEDCYFGFYFAIYEAGDWEIQFRFPNESPLFD